MLYNRAPGLPGPLGNAPPSSATSAIGRQAVSAIGGQPSMISPVGVPTGSPLLQPGSGYSGTVSSNAQPGSNPASSSGFGPGIGSFRAPTPVQGVSPPANMNPWTSSRNRSTLLRALIGNHTTPGMQG